MVKQLDICLLRVVTLKPKNQQKNEHASHLQTIRSAYTKLNLHVHSVVQGYKPDTIWKNHWGQDTISYTRNSGNTDLCTLRALDSSPEFHTAFLLTDFAR